jgi:putative ABC transport system ATP-binding protein
MSTNHGVAEIDEKPVDEMTHYDLSKGLPFAKKLGETIVNLTNIAKAYTIKGRNETLKALENIDLNDNNEFYSVKKGEFVMIRGPSGGGKTTLLNIIGTIDKPTGGTLEILGTPVTASSSDNYLADLRLKRIGFVFQTFNLIATMSAFENVELPMTLLGKLGKKARKDKAKELLKLVGLEDRMAHLPSELSGGEQQRVTIARALSNEPDILLLDEPTGDLDTKNTIEIMDLLLRINLFKKTTCIMVTHNPDVECYADRILYVSDGKFAKQVLNEIQCPLIYEHYQEHLKTK